MAEFKSKVQRVLDNVTQHLGEDAVFKPCNGTSFDVRVVFDNAFELVDPDTETVISSNAPRLLVRLSDFADGINQGDKFVVDGNTYEVWTVQEDGQGGAEIGMYKQE